MLENYQLSVNELVNKTKDDEAAREQLLTNIISDVQLILPYKMFLLKIKSKDGWNLGLRLAYDHKGEAVKKYIQLLLTLFTRGQPPATVWELLQEQVEHLNFGKFLALLHDADTCSQYLSLLTQLQDKGIPAHDICAHLAGSDQASSFAVLYLNEHGNLNYLMAWAKRRISSYVKFGDLDNNPQKFISDFKAHYKEIKDELSYIPIAAVNDDADLRKMNTVLFATVKRNISRYLNFDDLDNNFQNYMAALKKSYREIQEELGYLPEEVIDADVDLHKLKVMMKAYSNFKDNKFCSQAVSEKTPSFFLPYLSQLLALPECAGVTGFEAIDFEMALSEEALTLEQSSMQIRALANIFKYVKVISFRGCKITQVFMRILKAARDLAGVDCLLETIEIYGKVEVDPAVLIPLIASLPPEKGVAVILDENNRYLIQHCPKAGAVQRLMIDVRGLHDNQQLQQLMAALPSQSKTLYLRKTYTNEFTLTDSTVTQLDIKESRMMPSMFENQRFQRVLNGFPKLWHLGLKKLIFPNPHSFLECLIQCVNHPYLRTLSLDVSLSPDVLLKLTQALERLGTQSNLTKIKLPGNPAFPPALSQILERNRKRQDIENELSKKCDEYRKKCAEIEKAVTEFNQKMRLQHSAPNLLCLINTHCFYLNDAHGILYDLLSEDLPLDDIKRPYEVELNSYTHLLISLTQKLDQNDLDKSDAYIIVTIISTLKCLTRSVNKFFNYMSTEFITTCYSPLFNLIERFLKIGVKEHGEKLIDLENALFKILPGLPNKLELNAINYKAYRYLHALYVKKILRYLVKIGESQAVTAFKSNLAWTDDLTALLGYLQTYVQDETGLQKFMSPFCFSELNRMITEELIPLSKTEPQPTALKSCSVPVEEVPLDVAMPIPPMQSRAQDPDQLPVAIQSYQSRLDVSVNAPNSAAALAAVPAAALPLVNPPQFTLINSREDQEQIEHGLSADPRRGAPPIMTVANDSLLATRVPVRIPAAAAPASTAPKQLSPASSATNRGLFRVAPSAASLAFANTEAARRKLEKSEEVDLYDDERTVDATYLDLAAAPSPPAAEPAAAELIPAANNRESPLPAGSILQSRRPNQTR